MEEEGKIRVPDLSPINDFSTITKTERRGNFQVCSLGMNSWLALEDFHRLVGHPL